MTPFFTAVKKYQAFKITYNKFSFLSVETLLRTLIKSPKTGVCLNQITPVSKENDKQK